MNATITGTCGCALDGGRTRIEYDPNQGDPVLVKQVDNGASDSFSASFADQGDKLVAARWKPGSSASGYIGVTGGPANGKITCSGGQIATLDGDGNGGTSFAFSHQGDELRVEHA